MIRIDRIVYKTRRRFLGIPYGKTITKTEMGYIQYNELAFYVKETNWDAINRFDPSLIKNVSFLGLRWIKENATPLKEIVKRIEEYKITNKFIQEEFKKEEL